MLFKELVEVFERLKKTSSRLEKTAILADFIKDVPADDLPIIVNFCTGKIFPTWDERKIGIASQSMVKIISSVSYNSEPKVIESYKHTGHLGITAEEMFQKKAQQTFFAPEDITVRELYDTFVSLSEMSGTGSATKKQKTLMGILRRADPKEAHYIVSLTIEYVLSGAKEGVMEEAIAKAFNVDASLVRRASMLTSDLGESARIAKTEGKEGLESISIKPMRPVRPMLAQNVASIEEAMEAMGGIADFETKYDGARLQIHKQGDKVKLYSRRLEDLTEALPEIVTYVNRSVKADSAILDSECIAIDASSGRPIPFQNILTRLRRIYKVEETQKKYPLYLRPFDVLYVNGKSMIDEPFKKRRIALENIIEPLNSECSVALAMITSDPEKARILFNEAVQGGNEGLMAKDLEATYTPGMRGKKMVKIKSALDTLDLAIVSAEWGHGRKAGWLTSFEVAAFDEESEQYVVFGKVASGFSDEQLEDITERLKPLKIGEHERIIDVSPEIIVEVKFEEIQKSPVYSSGYALRFPRLVRIRDDLNPEEVNSFSRVMNIYNIQQRYERRDKGTP
ncbi:DNA ligase [Methanocella sp. CWC-04]|uniref:DNA ligase n=1 Tax=Methanooceanicella nereidis TaxID=2052831 RepID=A0AAP2RDY2_9EURY|nr:ATP-dependent DNA ligase [Methanocella sp. CWC-04]MCD1295011.1 DNA ligase [Methanocella sp. CWC-04]